MWGNKKLNLSSPPAAVPAPSKTPETNPTKPIPARVEDKVMSSDAIRPLVRLRQELRPVWEPVCTSRAKFRVTRICMWTAAWRV